MKNSTVLHIPHSSTFIPERFAGTFIRGKLAHEIDVMTDWFCDELFECGRDSVIFPVSRLVCDVERFADDEQEIMAKIGMGVTYRTASDLTPLREVGERERKEILSQYYDRHHRAFTDLVEEKLKDFGNCLIVDCHSFYPAALPYELCQEEDRPDFCIGTSEFHTPQRITDALRLHLEEAGYSVRIDSPFAGTIVPMKFYGKDRRVVSVMIEVNRKLYLEKPGIRNGRFAEIKRVLAECVALAEEAM